MNRHLNNDNTVSPEAHLRLLAEQNMLDRFNRSYGHNHRQVLALRLLLLALIGGLVLAVAVNRMGLSQPVAGGMSGSEATDVINQIVTA